MRILLTGATGFLGAHVLRHLLREDRHEAAVLVRPTSDTWRIAELLPRVRRIEGDLRDLAAVEPALAHFAPQTVLHLAWDGVGNQDRNNLKQTRNLECSVQLLELVQRCGAKHWIALGSQAEYGPYTQRIPEDAPPRPTTLYGVTKLSAGLLTQELCHRLAVRFAWLRLFSSYGEMDNPGWLIPDLILRLLKGQRPALTAGTQQWDYLYVHDAAAAICAVAEHPDAAGIFNLGSGQTHTIRSVVEKVRDLINPRLPLGFGEVPFRPNQVMHLQADIERLRGEVGFSPRVALDDGLARTVEWYREQRSGHGV